LTNRHVNSHNVYQPQLEIGMAVNTVIIPPDISAAFDAWYAVSGDFRGVGEAIEDLILEGLAKPAAVKQNVSRAHVLNEDLREKRHSIGMSPNTWAAISSHAKEYGISRAEAFRELLRLGLGISSPQPRDVSVAQSRRRSPAKVKLWQKIIHLSKSGVQQTVIADHLGISRQHVSIVLKRHHSDMAFGRSLASPLRQWPVGVSLGDAAAFIERGKSAV
jgi:hypothetical protein